MKLTLTLLLFSSSSVVTALNLRIRATEKIVENSEPRQNDTDLTWVASSAHFLLYETQSCNTASTELSVSESNKCYQVPSGFSSVMMVDDGPSVYTVHVAQSTDCSKAELSFTDRGCYADWGGEDRKFYSLSIVY